MTCISVVDDLESHFVLEGALAIQPLASHLEGFDEYFTSLNVDEHEKINPWFREYWDAFFRCKSKPRSSRHIDESQVLIFLTYYMLILLQKIFLKSYS